MQTPSWAPPIPVGAVAVDQWRQLDRDSRVRLLRGTPAPDPLTATIAVGYARTMLQSRWRRRRVLPMALVLFAGLVGMVAAGATLPKHVVEIVSIPVEVALASAFVVWAVRQRLALIRMENVNAPLLMASAAPSPAPAAPAGSAPELVVRHDRARLLRRCLLAWSITIAYTVAVPLLLRQPALMIVFATIAVLVTVLVARVMVRWVLPRRPTFVVDRTGVFSELHGTRASWEEIVEIRVVPLRAGRMGRGRRVVVFIPADPQRVLSGAAHPGVARRSHRYYGSPICVADLLMDHTADEIVAAASRFTSAPIRHLGDTVKA